MLFVPAPWQSFFRPEAALVVAMVAQVMFANVDLGMGGLPMVGMVSFTPPIWLTSVPTSLVVKVARAPVVGVVETLVVVVETAGTTLLGEVTVSMATGVMGGRLVQPVMTAASRRHPIPGMPVATIPAVVRTAWPGRVAAEGFLRVAAKAVRIWRQLMAGSTMGMMTTRAWI